MVPSKATAAQSRQPQVLPKAAGQGHVLIVDDETSVRDFLDLVLRNAGYVTARAMNGYEALDMAEQFGPFDLLVTDEMMPKMEGHVLADRLREREPWVKVLYLTGYSERLFAAKDSWCDDEAFLDKPSSVHGLLEAVSQLMGNKVSKES
jgi:two-component system cell cycle sensor histidine kinase/response regulator CckA